MRVHVNCLAGRPMPKIRRPALGGTESEALQEQITLNLRASHQAALLTEDQPTMGNIAKERGQKKTLDQENARVTNIVAFPAPDIISVHNTVASLILASPANYVLTEWQIEFAESILAWPHPTISEKQWSILGKIAYQVARAARRVEGRQ